MPVKRLASHSQLLAKLGGTAADLAIPKQFTAFVRKLFRQDWVVYAKPAFGGPEAVLRYLGRYTHRVAISNHRLLSFDGERVTFRWKVISDNRKVLLTTIIFPYLEAS